MPFTEPIHANGYWSAFIPAKPTPKGRPRFANGIVYTPASTTNAEREIKQLLARLNIPKLDGELGLTLSFNITKARTSRLDYPHFGADIDNLAKLVMDAMNDVAYADDAHITHLYAHKQFASPEGIRIGLWQVGSVHKHTESDNVNPP